MAASSVVEMAASSVGATDDERAAPTAVLKDEKQVVWWVERWVDDSVLQ